MLLIRLKIYFDGKEQPVADITISGQSSANPAQASTNGTNKPSLKAGVPFELLLAIFQAGGLPGQIIPGPNGELQIACDISRMTDAELSGKCPGKNAAADLIAAAVQLQAEGAKGKGEADPDSGPPALAAEAAKTGVVNLIALLNSGGKSAAGSVSANAVKPESPALMKAMAGQDGRTAPAAGNGQFNDLAALAKQDLSNARTDISGNTAAGHKSAGLNVVPDEDAKPEKSVSDIPVDKAKIAAAKAAEADIPTGLKGGSQETSGKNPDAEIAGKAAAWGAENIRLKANETPGEKTTVPGLKTEAAKAPQSENTVSPVRTEHPETAMTGHTNNFPETASVKGTEIKAEREVEPRTEPVKAPGQTLQGGIHAQSSLNGTAAAAATGADIGFGEALNGAVLEQVSAGTIELFRDGGRVRLSLDPPELGSVDMDLIVDRNGMKLVLTSDSGAVRHVLQANMDQLRSSLHDQGMTRFDILVQDRPNSDAGGWQAGGNSGRDFLQSGGGGENGQSRDDGSPAFTRPATDSRTATATGRDNLNGELSLFA